MKASRTSFSILTTGLLLGAAAAPVAAWTVSCAGAYGGHLQGVDADGTNIWWSFTVEVVKTDASGAVLATTGTVPSHHGDLCLVDGVVYVAVNLGPFNTEDRADSWVYAYRADDLSFIRRWAVPELVHGAGGMTWHDGSFYVVGGLPATGHDRNYVYEYTPDFVFVRRHELPGYTYKGIQTAFFWNGRFWFGIYGETGNPAGRLDCAPDFSDLVRTPDAGNVGLTAWNGLLATGATGTDASGRHTGRLASSDRSEHIIGWRAGQFQSETVAAGTTVGYYDLFPGGAAGATGVLEVAGSLSVDRKLTIARQPGSVGRVHLAAGGAIEKAFIEDKPFYVGYAGHGELELDDVLTLAPGDTLHVGFQPGSDGHVRVNADGLLAGSSLKIGTGEGTAGVLDLRGGRVEIPGGPGGYYPLQVGNPHATAAGEIRGWGAFARTGSGNIRISQYGRVVADGRGEPRDLDLGAFRTVGAGNGAQASTNFRNPAGTAGWYAVNGGRLVFPHAQEVYVRASQPVSCTGDYCYTTNAFLNNAVVFSLKGAASDKYFFAALYAPDRPDVPPAPRGLSPVSVWRLGYAKEAASVDPLTPVPFASIDLRVRPARDSLPAAARGLQLRRWDGTDWRLLSRADADAVELAASGLAPYTDPRIPGYNVGWVAVFAENARSTVLLIK